MQATQAVINYFMGQLPMPFNIWSPLDKLAMWTIEKSLANSNAVLPNVLWLVIKNMPTETPIVCLIQPPKE